MTVMRSCFWLGLGVVLLVLPVGGCATVTLDVECDYDGSFDFAAVRTWDWMPGAQPDIPDPRVMDSVVDGRMRDTIAAELKVRGLAKVDRAIPDVWVQYRIWIMPRGDFNPVDGAEPRPEVGGPVEKGRLDDVGLRIEMFHAFERERKVWSAEGRARLDLRVTERRREERTTAAVRKLLTCFPPK